SIPCWKRRFCIQDGRFSLILLDMRRNYRRNGKFVMKIICSTYRKGGQPMTYEKKPYPCRMKKKKGKNGSNSIFNIMIGLVFALILIIGVSMLFSGGDDQANEAEEVAISTGTEEQTSGSDDGESASAGDEDEDAEAKAEEEAAKKAEEEAKAKEEAAKKAKEEKEKEEEGSVTKG